MSKHYAKPVETLRQLLEECDDLGKIGHSFFDLTEVSGFLESGQVVQNELFETLLKAGLEAMFQRPVTVVHSNCIYVASCNIYHGPCMVEDRNGAMFYFEDLSKGLLWLYNPHTGNTDFLRITATMIPVKEDESVVLARPEQPATD